MNRRNLLLLSGVATACPTIIFPTLAHAVIPPPPSSLFYLLFIADGIYKISGFYVVDLPASYGTCATYDEINVSRAVKGLFTFTGPHGVSPFNMLIGAPSTEWWEVYDRRNGRIMKLWKYDRFEVRFADNSRVKVVFNGRNASTLFWPLTGSERKPDGTLLNPPNLRGTLGGGRRGRGDHSGPTGVTPGIKMFAWHWSSQETPW